MVLEAVISKDGAMENLRLISGHPMLVKAAIQAVSQWRYSPYILNGDPIEVETQITVNFTLGGISQSALHAERETRSLQLAGRRRHRTGVARA